MFISCRRLYDYRWTLRLTFTKQNLAEVQKRLRKLFLDDNVSSSYICGTIVCFTKLGKTFIMSIIGIEMIIMLGKWFGIFNWEREMLVYSKIFFISSFTTNWFYLNCKLCKYIETTDGQSVSTNIPLWEWNDHYSISAI